MKYITLRGHIIPLHGVYLPRSEDDGIIRLSAFNCDPVKLYKDPPIVLCAVIYSASYVACVDLKPYHCTYADLLTCTLSGNMHLYGIVHINPWFPTHFLRFCTSKNR